MGRKIFVSYKYADKDVESLEYGTTVRIYVDKLEDYFSKNDIYKGESDDEDLSQLSDDTIWNKLKDRIYDSSVTIVMISPNMKEPRRWERSQWIPWEISYSLKEMTRNDKASHSNAMLAVVLPNKNGSYSYFIEETSNGIRYKTETLFKILGSNMFNRKDKQKNGEHSYIKQVKWSAFIKNAQYYIDKAVEIKANISDYIITKEVSVMSEEQIKHLEFIQNVITRMNDNSFQLKSWSITIMAALLALYASSQNITFIVIAIIPTVIFWFLDTYYLQQERQFRGIYNDVAGLTEEQNKISVRLFDMPLQEYKKEKDEKYGYRDVFFSKTLVLFYFPQIVLLSIGSLILSGILCK